MMRVLQIIESLTVGGAERLVVELSEELKHRGVDCRVACLSSPGSWAARLEKSGLFAGSLGKRPGFDPACRRRLRSLVRALRAQVVQSHLFTGNLWARLAGMPRRRWGLVATLHNVDSWRGPLHRITDRALAGAADRYVAVGKAVADYYASELPARRAPVVIPNGIAWRGNGCKRPFSGRVGSFGTAWEVNTAASEPVLRSCGRLVEQKGFDVLVEAAAKLAARGRRFAFEIIGDGPARPALSRLIERRGLSGSVRLLGERDDARRLIASADVFVLPSLREGLPLVLLEAMHAGRPVVASALPAVEEAAGDAAGESRVAIFVEPGDAGKLAAALERLLGDHGEARRLGEAARRRARELFSIERVADAYLRLYTEVIEERGL